MLMFKLRILKLSFLETIEVEKRKNGARFLTFYVMCCMERIDRGIVRLLDEGQLPDYDMLTGNEIKAS